MPIIQTAFPPMHCADVDQLEAFLSVAQVRSIITRNQSKAILIALRHALPCTVDLRQRTPKSVTYVHINGAHAYTVNPRAHISQRLDQ